MLTSLLQERLPASRRYPIATAALAAALGRWRMTVGVHPAIVDELLALRRAVVAVHCVKLLALDEPALRETAQRRRVVAAVPPADIHGLRPVQRGERFQDVTLAIGQLVALAGSSW